MWRDVASIMAGDEWRISIDSGIQDCSAIIFAMSPSSCASHYVTYEWARALGMAKPIIPVLLEDCNRHPKIEPIQYIDFRSHNESTWQQLVQKVQSTLKENEKPEAKVKKSEKSDITTSALTESEIETANSIRGYLQEHGFRMMSFDRVRQKFDKDYTNEFLIGVVTKSEDLARAVVKGGKPGLKFL